MSAASRPSIHIQAIPQGEDSREPASPLSPFEKQPLRPAISDDKIILKIKATPDKSSLANIDSSRRVSQAATKSTLANIDTSRRPSTIAVPAKTETILIKLRKHFIRKVLAILFLQLSITGLSIGVTFIPELGVRGFMANNLPTALVAIVLCIGSLIFLLCKKEACKKVPRNYLLLLSYTVGTAYLLGSIAAASESKVILYAGIGTCGIVISIFAYTWFAKGELTRLGIGITMLSMTALQLIVVAIILKGQIVQLMWSGIMALFFGIHLTFNVQRLIGRYENQYSLDDYIIAALDIYVDIIQIFLIMIDVLRRILE